MFYTQNFECDTKLKNINNLLLHNTRKQGMQGLDFYTRAFSSPFTKQR